MFWTSSGYRKVVTSAVFTLIGSLRGRPRPLRSSSGARFVNKIKAKGTDKVFEKSRLVI